MPAPRRLMLPCAAAVRLSILYLRCHHIEDEDMYIFDSVTFNSLFEMRLDLTLIWISRLPALSILYLRCVAMIIARYGSRITIAMLSILYLRCCVATRAETSAGRPFNSLFEMRTMSNKSAPSPIAVSFQFSI